MSERFASDLLFILVVLIVAAILGFIIGYLIRRYKHLKLQVLEDEMAQLKIKLDACHRDKQSLLAVSNNKTGMTFDAKEAADALGYKIVQDDLKIVEGIGEKIESILKNRGIDTWFKLSKTSDVEIKDILLTEGGSKYSIHEPRTWPQQALLAFEGKWAELKKYQDELNAGK